MGYHNMGINLSTKPPPVAVLTMASDLVVFFMLTGHDWVINCHCRRSLIPLIVKGELICLSCRHFNGF